MNHNPIVLTPEQLQFATDTEILASLYQFIVASTALAFTVVIFYNVFRFFVWFMPKFWYKSQEDN